MVGFFCLGSCVWTQPLEAQKSELEQVRDPHVVIEERRRLGPNQIERSLANHHKSKSAIPAFSWPIKGTSVSSSCRDLQTSLQPAGYWEFDNDLVGTWKQTNSS